MNATERVFDELARQNKTIASLCDFLGVKSNVVANWKNTTAVPPAKYLLKISEFLGVTTDYILAGKENATDEEVMEALSKDERQLLKYYNELPEAEQLIILGEVAKRFKEATTPDVYAAARDGGGFEKIENEDQAQKSSDLIRSRKKSDRPLP